MLRTHEFKVFPVIVPVSNKLKSINFFLVKRNNGLTLVDAGLNTDKCWDYLDETLKQNGHIHSDITEILLTHHHTDHIGLINRIIKQHPVPIYIHPYSIPKLKGETKFIQMHFEFFKNLYQEMGCGEIGSRQADYLYHTAIQGKDEKSHWEFREIDTNPLLGFDIIKIPGHSPDQIAFYHQNSRILFAGDLVIEHMASNAFVEPDTFGKRPKTLVQHKESLEKCVALSPRTIFSGHGKIIEDPIPLLKQRIKEIEEKAIEFLAIVQSGISTASEIAQYLYPYKYEKQFFSVMSKVIGYLDYLEWQGRLTPVLEKGVWHFYPIGINGIRS
ncbi:MBL fold metallo-hydrolase [Virgibacillus sediminis]|uniref:MBL fold metallo-hydrolase n=1 Tax=Virgibacillus sediminis TaxID=202260 RepID=A0ABV7A3W1_9BACI